MASDGWPWFALRVRSNFEHVTAASLSGKGYDPFLPTYHVRRRWSDRTKQADCPLFPGYVFCRFNISDRLPVLICPGVVNVVSFGGQPAVIDDSEIVAVQRLLASNVDLRPCAYLRVGRSVLIEDGPLRGLEGIVIEQKNSFRLVVSVTMLQRSVSAEVERDWLRPLR